MEYRDELTAGGEASGVLRRRTVRQGAVTFVGQIAQAVLQLLTTAILARLLLPSDFGLIAMVAVVTAFVSVFRDLGLTQAVVQKARIDGQQLTALFWANLTVTVVLALVVVAASPGVAWFYDEPALTTVTAVLGGFVVASGLGSLQQALLARRMEFGRLVSIELLSFGVGAAVAVALAAGGAGYWALVALLGVQAAVQSLLVWLASPWRPGAPRRLGDASSMLRFGLGVTGFNIANLLSRQADNVLIGWRWGAGPLGHYSRAYGILLLPLRQINAPLSRVALPALARLITQPDRYRRVYTRMLRLTATVGCVGLAVVAVTADWVVWIILGPDWEPAGPILAWLALGGLLQPVSNTTGWLFLSQDRSGEYLRWGVGSSLLTVAAFVVGLPYGAVGVAAAYGISGVVLRAPLLIWYVGRRGPVTAGAIVSAVTLPLTLALAAACAALAVRLSIDLSPGLGLLVAIGTAAATTAALILALPAGSRLVSDVRNVAAELRPASGKVP